MYRNTLKNYLDDLASSKPAPGGGSAAALIAATAVSLIGMVAAFTVGREKYKAFEREAKQILSSSEELREKLLKLVDEDVRGYEKLSRAFKMHKTSAAEKTKRSRAIQQGLKDALIAPVDVCKYSHEAVKLCLPLARRGNVNLITDTGIAAMGLECAFASAMYNVEINFKSIKDEKFILEVREVLEPMEKELDALNKEVKSEVERHLRKG